MSLYQYITVCQRAVHYLLINALYIFHSAKSHFIHILLFSCCTLFILHFCHVAILLCWCTFSRLQFLHAALFHTALFPCCLFFELSFFHSALFLCCSLLCCTLFLLSFFTFHFFSCFFLGLCCNLFSFHSFTLHLFRLSLLHVIFFHDQFSSLKKKIKKGENDLKWYNQLTSLKNKI